MNKKGIVQIGLLGLLILALTGIYFLSGHKFTLGINTVYQDETITSNGYTWHINSGVNLPQVTGARAGASVSGNPVVVSTSCNFQDSGAYANAESADIFGDEESGTVNFIVSGSASKTTGASASCTSSVMLSLNGKRVYSLSPASGTQSNNNLIYNVKIDRKTGLMKVYLDTLLQDSYYIGNEPIKVQAGSSCGFSNVHTASCGANLMLTQMIVEQEHEETIPEPPPLIEPEPEQPVDTTPTVTPKLDFYDHVKNFFSWIFSLFKW